MAGERAPEPLEASAQAELASTSLAIGLHALCSYQGEFLWTVILGYLF